MTDVVEALSARVFELSQLTLAPFDPHGDVTLRAVFHYLKTHLDGVVIRVEQACAVVDALHPGRILVFGYRAMAHDRPHLPRQAGARP